MRRILALDPGERRVGLAFSVVKGDLITAVADSVWPRNRAFFSMLQELVEAGEYELILVGRPRSLDGSLGPAASQAEGFARRISDQLPGISVKMIDETATTTQAHERLQGRDPSKVDAVAAQIILEDYLSEHPEI